MSDDTLLTEFVLAGNESAFAALVRRHVDLVYATARRQVGDATLAEEITQNVFIALARKSGRLREFATISGWLYQTTLLEARQVLRSELRRHRREAAALELSTMTREGESPWAAVVPLLDEALTKLRDGDRLAVLLRFFEQKPFREVGRVLGISEDAAQKRVAKSLDELTGFFQRRGFRVSCLGAAGASLFAEAAIAAPAHLSVGATRISLAAAGPPGGAGIGLLAWKIMNLTKFQTAVACVCLATVPVAFEARELQSARRENAALMTGIAATRENLADAVARRDNWARRARAASLAADLATATSPTPAAARASTGLAWVDGSPYARVSKELLERVKVNALSSNWKVRPEVAAILGLTPGQFDGLQQAVNQYFEETRALEEAHLERLTDDPVAGDGPGKVVFRINRYEPEANAARLRLRDGLREALGGTRGDLALRYLDFMPARRPAPGPDEPWPDGDYFEKSGHGSDRWNFHGYERTITMEPPADVASRPSFTIDVKFGPRDSMSFGGDRHLLNPAAASTLKAQWDLFSAARTKVTP